MKKYGFTLSETLITLSINSYPCFVAVEDAEANCMAGGYGFACLHLLESNNWVMDY